MEKTSPKAETILLERFGKDGFGLYSYMKYTNSASARVAVKNGMRFIGEYPVDVNYLTRVYCVNRKEWKMSTIKNYEERMWQAAKNGDNSEFAKLVDMNAVMVCGGYRCTGAEYAGFICDFGISDYEITNFEIVHETDKSVQVHYIVTTTANAPENADLAGKFHVTSTWENRDGKWILVFNMDSRIME